jgi:hypothetical protein
LYRRKAAASVANNIITLYCDFMSIEANRTGELAVDRDLQLYGPEGKVEVELVPTNQPGVYDVLGPTLTTRFVSIAEAFPDKPPLPLDLC